MKHFLPRNCLSWAAWLVVADIAVGVCFVAWSLGPQKKTMGQVVSELPTIDNVTGKDLFFIGPVVFVLVVAHFVVSKLDKRGKDG